MFDAAKPRCGTRLPGATLGVELAAVPVDGCTALAAKLKSDAGAPPTAPRSAGVVVTSEAGARPVSGAADAPVSALPGATPGLVCTWSAVTGWRVRSEPLGWGVAGPPGTGLPGSAAAPVPGTRATSTVPSVATPARSKETAVPSALNAPWTAPAQLYCGFELHAPAWAGCHAPVAGQARTTI